MFSLPPAFVLSQDQTLKFSKTLIWLYLVTLELTRTFTPRHLRALVDLFSQNVSAKVSFEPIIPGGIRGSAGLCRPRFSFFNIQLSKNRLRKRDVVGRIAFGSGPGRVSLTRLSLDFTRANSFVASGAPPSL